MNGRTRSTVLASLALGTLLAASVALAGGTARQADAASNEKIVFDSERTRGAGVDNPTGDPEIFKMNPDGTGLKQLTFNRVNDSDPTLSPSGKKIAYTHGNDVAFAGAATSNPEGDIEVYVMNAIDGSEKKNLSNTGAGVHDYGAVFSPGGKRIAYVSYGVQDSNPEGDEEVYRVNVLDGTGKKNLTNTGADIGDDTPVFSPDGKKIAYESYGVQDSNLEGDYEVYRMNTLDGSDQKNLSNNGADIGDYTPAFSPDGKKIAYASAGIQNSNSEGEFEVYVMNALDGTGQKNLSNTGLDVEDYGAVFSPGGKRIAYVSHGVQDSNPQGDREIYRMNALDGSGQKNLSNSGDDIYDSYPDFSPDGTRIAYESNGVQNSNPEGDYEVYRMNTLDGTGKKNLTNNGRGVYDGSLEWGVQAP